MIEAIELTSARRPRGVRGGPVENVSFDVYPGQVTALLGAAGTGKSTVLRLMAELEPGGGRTLFGGRPFHALRPAIREVGLALNPDAVHPGRTVQAHLQLYSAAGGVPKGRIAEVLEVAGLSTQATVRCGRLDAGQRQRLSIAAALLGDPAALILDEPHALDSHGMSWFHALIRAYAAQGRTVLVAATDPDSLSGTADHVVILRRDDHDGVSRVIASRSAAEVFDEHRVTVVQVRSPQAARLAAALETEGARLAPAGPGALQVRGLDRARIGEIAHVAGICLHELSEIGHDDDVFGLRPVPRQKELLPGLTHTDALWPNGTRSIADETDAIDEIDEIEEAEVVEAAEVAETAELPVAVGVGAQASAEPVIAAVAEAEPSGVDDDRVAARSAARGRWRAQSSQWWAVKSVAEENTGSGGETANSTASAEQQHSDRASEESASSAETTSQTGAASAGTVRQPTAGAQAGASSPPSAAESQGTATAAATVLQPAAGTQAAASSQPQVAESQAAAAFPQPAASARAAASQASAATVPQPTAGAPAAGSQPSPKDPEPTRSATSTADPVTESASAAPVVVRSIDTPALRRSSSFGLRWGRDRSASPAPAQPPAPGQAQAQPAVPFTVAASASADRGAADGMTPWRAVAVRASQQSSAQQSSAQSSQVPVAEAAPAEQETSA